jgi:hypothetical protein
MITFGSKARTQIQFDNSPLRSCSQRPSDSPQYDPTSSGKKSRRRRSIDDDYDLVENFLSQTTYGRPKRYIETRPKRSITYAFDTFCQNIFQSMSSSLST